MTYRIGIIGLGSIGQRMLSSIHCHERFVVHAAWDPDKLAGERVRANWEQLILAHDAHSVITDPQVDLLYIACPPAFHREYALAAIDAGKPIFCEKPLGVDLAQSRELVTRVEDSGLPNAVNLLFGSARSSDMVASAIERGVLGDVNWVELRFHLPRWASKRFAEAPWLKQRAQGGFVREVGTHYIYLCQRLFGPLEVGHIRLDHPGDGSSAERFAHVELRAGAVPITLAGTTEAAGPELNQCILWGSKATYRIREIHALDIADNQRWVEAFPVGDPPERDTHLRQLGKLARLLDGDKTELPVFRDALAAQEIVEEILASPAQLPR